MNEHSHHAVAAMTGSVDALSAIWGGFSSFFSIWFFCLFQISPFFIAFMAAATATGASEKGGRLVKITGALPAAILCLASYTIFFTLSGASASTAGMVLFKYSGLLGQLGGILAMLLGAWFVGFLRGAAIPQGLVINGGGLLLGAALAFNYRPCATPTLTLIYNLTKDPATVGDGSLYLYIYASGVSLAFLLTAVVISGLLVFPCKEAVLKWTRIIGGILLLIFGILVLTDWMVVYKSLLVGGFV